MSTRALAACQRLGAALGGLKQTAAQAQAQARALVERVGQQGMLDEHCHTALIAKAQTASRQSEQACSQVERDGHKSVEALQRCRQAIDEALRAVTGEMYGPLGDMDVLGQVLSQGLHSARERFWELNAAQVQASTARAEGLLRYDGGLQQASQQLAAIAAALRQADAAAAVGVQTEQHLEAAQAERQAADLAHQAALACHQGHTQTALALIEQAAAHAPCNATIRLSLCMLCLQAGRLEQAAREWQAAAGLEPRSTEVLYAEGMLALRSGQATHAAELLEQCVARAGSPSDEVDYRLGLAEAHYQDGHPQRAVAEWRRVLAIEPMHPIAGAYLRALEGDV
ncbi:MAG TPA: tetratricopeptide repeat protein [Anaerolineae bacterium]|nr:tetratricopeptide repeat protein [Anaerolineae bacterium]HOQ97680.1 tetratricopeptide repeat protein [Anaerolineae bacterium]HPL26612.1 tetratricopeptide repeat protein [Anaerolineae bacterium]